MTTAAIACGALTRDVLAMNEKPRLDVTHSARRRYCLTAHMKFPTRPANGYTTCVNDSIDGVLGVTSVARARSGTLG
jgi:hypothetical protein